MPDYTIQELTRMWTAYEGLLIKARRAEDEEQLKELATARVDLEDEIAKHSGLVRVANIFWLDGKMLQPGERVRVRLAQAEWRLGRVGQFANVVELADGSTVRLLDLERLGDIERRVD